jgi:hypothetical protein
MYQLYALNGVPNPPCSFSRFSIFQKPYWKIKWL